MTADRPTPAVHVREAGDSALLMEVGDIPAPDGVLDARVNDVAIRLARELRERRLEGVRDVLSTFRSVAVFFDPLVADAAAVAAVVRKRLDKAPDPASGTLIEVPVAYGNDEGPDLPYVAAFAGCAPEEVIRRHAGRTYRVFMLGFLPGFPYLAPVDGSIAAPRRQTPRVRVPAGSVGIAGRQTGIYPRESPGGWQIIGRTSLGLFDADRQPPSLLAPGDLVRFVPVGDRPVPPERSSPVDPAHVSGSSGRHLTVLRSGLLTTIQDLGRWGYQHLGVPVSGPMDALAHRLANELVGNPRDAATLEVTMLGPELRFEQGASIAIAGGDLGPTLDGASLAMDEAVACPAGSVLRFSGRRRGARAYVAVDGGIASRPVLGSRATHVASGLGGLGGRALRAGDRVPLGPPSSSSGGPRPASVRSQGAVARLRILPGPQADWFPAAAFDALQTGRYQVSPQSDRMGYRLAGGPSLTGVSRGEMISDATVVGAVQVPPSGAPILLMADRQTTGGYPQLAVVITADLPIAGQLAPGDSVAFDLCSRREAIAALAAQEGTAGS